MQIKITRQGEQATLDMPGREAPDREGPRLHLARRVAKAIGDCFGVDYTGEFADPEAARLFSDDAKKREAIRQAVRGAKQLSRMMGRLGFSNSAIEGGIHEDMMQEIFKLAGCEEIPFGDDEPAF